MVHFGGVDAFSYNSAVSEPIWMKSGALTDFGHGPHSVVTAREPGEILFYFLSYKQRTISPVSR